MAFLSWLMSQGRRLSQIAQEMVSLGDSGTLAQLYANLTSDPASNALPMFLAAVGNLPDGVTNDDPFGGAAQPAQMAHLPPWTAESAGKVFAASVGRAQIERVMRTDFYYEGDIEVPDYLPHHELASNLSVAWLKTVIPSPILDPTRFEGDLIGYSVVSRLDEATYPERLIEASIFFGSRSDSRFVDRYLVGQFNRPPSPEPLVEGILSESVIVERSPPLAVSIKDLLSGGLSTTVGTLVGAEMGMEHPLLCIVTVPLGVILMGAVMGVSKGLERGLAKVVENALVPINPIQAPSQKSIKTRARPQRRPLP